MRPPIFAVTIRTLTQHKVEVYLLELLSTLQVPTTLDPLQPKRVSIFLFHSLPWPCLPVGPSVSGSYPGRELSVSLRLGYCCTLLPSNSSLFPLFLQIPFLTSSLSLRPFPSLLCWHHGGRISQLQYLVFIRQPAPTYPVLIPLFFRPSHAAALGVRPRPARLPESKVTSNSIPSTPMFVLCMMEPSAS